MHQPPTSLDPAACDREPIHLLGTIQPSGCLLALTGDWVIRHVSRNVAQWTGLAPDRLLGRPASDILDREVEHAIRGRLHVPSVTASVERVFGHALVADGPACDIGVHRSGGLIVLEAETPDADDRLDAVAAVGSTIAQLQQASDLRTLHERAARQLRALSGFDRVMVYRFGPEGAGEVIAEAARPGAEAYLGLHFPASDIPPQARALYERNLLRLIADVDAEPVPILSAPPAGPDPIDLSLAMHRSVSPVHIEYLRNMGVSASMSVSIIVNGRLWGLFACHHLRPRRLGLARRGAIDLFGRMFSLLLESRERQILLQQEAVAQAAKDRILASVDPEQDLFDSLSRFADQLRELIPFTGVAIWHRGRARLSGQTPPAEALPALIERLGREEASGVHATDELGRYLASTAAWLDQASGLLAIPISRSPCDYLLLFRCEQPREVKWAGNPDKPVMPASGEGLRLSPRKSFETWKQSVRGRSAPWSEAQVRLADSLRTTLLEVVLRRSEAAERDRTRAHQRQELLIAELNHRVRNVLALIRGLLAQTRAGASSVEELHEVLSGRIQALARAHDQLTDRRAGPAPLRALLEAEIDTYSVDRGQRAILDGPPVCLQAHALTAMALVVHELATNAVKYGALSVPDGRLHVRWRLAADGALHLEWIESGGPPVEPPRRAGFGTTVIERTIPHDLGGVARVDRLSTGLRAAFTIPPRHVERGVVDPPTPASARPRMAPASRPLEGRDVLLVEDNLVIALAAEDLLRVLGARHVEVASSTDDALASLDAAPCDVAVLDIHLGRESSAEVARALDERGVPYVFASGYDETDALPESLRHKPMVRKPYDRDALGRRLEQAIDGASAG